MEVSVIEWEWVKDHSLFIPGRGEWGDFGDYTVFRESVGESVVAKRVERVDYEKLSANQLPMGGEGGKGEVVLKILQSLMGR